MIIDGIDPPIQSLVTQYHEEKGRITYLKLFQHARVNGDALRARAQYDRSEPAKALLMDSDSSSSSLLANGTP